MGIISYLLIIFMQDLKKLELDFLFTFELVISNLWFFFITHNSSLSAVFSAVHLVVFLSFWTHCFFLISAASFWSHGGLQLAPL